MVQHAEFATCLAPKGQPVKPSFTWHNQMIQMTIGFFNTSCFEAYQSIARGRCHVRESIYMDQARFYDLDVGTGGPCYISLKSQWLNAAASNAVEASRSYIYIIYGINANFCVFLVRLDFPCCVSFKKMNPLLATSNTKNRCRRIHAYRWR